MAVAIINQALAVLAGDLAGLGYNFEQNPESYPNVEDMPKILQRDKDTVIPRVQFTLKRRRQRIVHVEIYVPPAIPGAPESTYEMLERIAHEVEQVVDLNKTLNLLVSTVQLIDKSEPDDDIDDGDARFGAIQLIFEIDYFHARNDPFNL